MRCSVNLPFSRFNRVIKIKHKKEQALNIYLCFPSQFNRSIRDTNLFFNETQICCSLIEIMRHVFFFGPKKIFRRFFGNFAFGVKIYFFNYLRELIFQLSTTSSQIDRFQQFSLFNVCNNLDYRIQL